MRSFPDDPDPSSRFSSTVVEQVATVCRRHSVARKVLFVPYVQLGRALETALARREGRWGGIECHTPATYASSLAAARLPPAHDSISGAVRTLLVWSMTRSLQEVNPDLNLDRPARLAPRIADAIGTLRTANVAPADVRRRADATDSAGGLLPILTAAYERYEQELDEHAFYDETDLFDEAIRAVASGESSVGATVFAACGETECHEQALRLLRVLRDHGKAFYQLETPASAPAPDTCAAALLQRPDSRQGENEPLVERIAPGETGAFRNDTLTFRRAVGPTREVRGAFRAILQARVPLDEVEIAYTASTPYLTRLADEAERIGVPITLGTGVPATVTRPGQALAGFYEWVQEGYPAPVLIRLLRSGLLRVHRWQAREGIAPPVPAHEIATVLAERRYEPGRQGYESALSAALENIDEEINDLKADGLSTTRAEEDKHRLGVARMLTSRLLDLVPRKATASTMAEVGTTFLRRFGPSSTSNVSEDGPDWALRTEEKTSLGRIARQVLTGTTLPELASAPIEETVSVARMARFFREKIGEQYVGAQQPTEGAAHVLPLESAGFTGRSHLAVVGLDSETASTAALDGSLLSEADRDAFRTGLEGTLPEPQAAGEEMAWRFRAALRRHRGAKMLIAMSFDPDEGEERAPSSLYLEWRAKAEDDAEDDDPLYGSLEGLRPPEARDAEERLLLSDAETWLAATRSEPDPGDGSAREALHDRYPWVQRGEYARRQRRSDTYTEFDGLLPGEHPELDFLDDRYDGPPLSAARLQMLAESPYAYFVTYVLGARPLNEPALGDEPWLTPLRKGAVLHRTYDRFMREVDEWPLTEAHRKPFLSVLDDEIDDEIAQVHPGSDAAVAEVRRRLKNEALLFFESERRRGDEVEPLLHEWGFGYGPRRRREEDAGRFALRLGEGERLRLRGRIDRVDRRRSDGTLAVWDYKTGSQSSFSRATPLKHGETLQWALYAFVLEQYRGEEVSESGYFFTSEKEMGTRLWHFPDETTRRTLEEILRGLSSLARTGSFPMRPDADGHHPWKWGDYDRLFPNLSARTDQLSEKQDHYPDDRPRPHFLDES